MDEAMEAPAEAAAAHDEEIKEAEPEVPLVERLWDAVKANPADFNAWTDLLQETDKWDDLRQIEACFEAFLAEFPLCYGYWKKYSDFVKDSPEKATEVYERAVKAVAHSVDIWLHYCAYASDKVETSELVRLYERAVACVGTDYSSHCLWDKYMEFASNQQDWNLIMQLHTRLLAIPSQQLDRYFGSFKNLATAKQWMGHENIKSNLPTEPKDLEKYIAIREALYRKTKDWDSKIRDFENAIRRPYFHVKPLDDAQLANWHKYLDFLEKEGDLQKAAKLYERCLIACANYPEYWMRYIDFFERQNNAEMANDALFRATKTFVKRSPEIHIFAAKWKERAGDTSGARETYSFITKELAPGHLESVVKYACFEKRQRNVEAACAVFDSAIASEGSKDESQTLAFLYVHYVLFLSRLGSSSRAYEVLQTALQKLPSSKLVVEAAIDYESHNPDRQVKKLQSIVEQATAAENTSLSSNEREDLSNRFLEFVDTFGDIDSVMETSARHERLFPFRKSYIEARKRLAHDSNFGDRKLMKSGSGSAQWPSYGTQGYAQTWQQQQQAPQGQWNTAAYGQQAAWYSGYGAQQAQPAAYGGAYGQQSYATQDMNGWNATGATAW